MKVQLAYGRGHIDVQLPAHQTTVIAPTHTRGLPDERAAVLQALDNPVGVAPLRHWLKPDSNVCISFTDLTRATPNERLIPWLLEYLVDIPPDRITLLNQLGTHRPNTQAELESMLTAGVVSRYRVRNHEPTNPDALLRVGTTSSGAPALLNRHFVQADVRVVTGFIEPHFFAGFSGGPKGIMPGVAGMETIMGNHCSPILADPAATFGVTEGNPVWEQMRDIARLAGSSFLLNVSLNESREITGVFAGDLLDAHRVGCAFVKRSAMQRVDRLFDLVLTTNSGYPLDLNLYQGVKGMCAAARIVKPGGTIILACECREGVPSGSSYEQLLVEAADPEAVLARLAAGGAPIPEQWQAQLQAVVQRRARVLLFSSLAEHTVKAAHLMPCADIQAAIDDFVRQYGYAAQIAVLPQGPLTIPYVQ